MPPLSELVAQFPDFIESASQAEPALPVTHATDAYLFQKIAESNMLSPADCPVFGQPLLYFFYGRPAYRVNSEEESSNLLFLAPVCLIFDGSVISKANRIYPFDSGAFSRNFFKRFMHDGMGMNNFSLKVTRDTPSKVVAAFFGTNKNYYDGKVLDIINTKDSCFEIEAYVDLIRYTARDSMDNRNSSIEIQIDKTISLSEPQLRAVVVPNALLDRKLFIDRVKMWGATPLPYRWVSRLKPSEYTSEIFSIVSDFLENEGYFQK
jgi:hypothetical protein